MEDVRVIPGITESGNACDANTNWLCAVGVAQEPRAIEADKEALLPAL